MLTLRKHDSSSRGTLFFASMNVLAELQTRFRSALASLVDDPAELVQMVRPSQDPKFGDYQANFAMPLGKRLGKPPREVATQVISNLRVDDLCEPPQVEGPGFINLRLKNQWIRGELSRALRDERLGVEKAAKPRTYIVDFSAPNVAKPMHVGHIRSTVIGAALERTLRYLGHKVVSDNHIGDWGTQFGMIIYGAKHFMNASAYRADAVGELSRRYRLVNRLVDYHKGRASLPKLEGAIERAKESLQRQKAEVQPGDKQAAKALRKAESSYQEQQQELAELRDKLSTVEQDPQLAVLAKEHPAIADDVLIETAKLHAGDTENRRLWREFLPPCLADIQRIYDRLGVTFDHTLGESFYEDRLEQVTEDLTKRGLARESDGALCIFLEGQSAPMIIRKQDGAFLYATTDLATIQYRVETWKPDAILYVVDHRQSLHFQQLFAAARLWGYENLELQHVSFGTVLGDDGRPFKTRSGDTVGLWGLLDEAVRRAYEIVNASAETGPDAMSDQRKREIAEAVGIGALKYADLSQNRTSDYVFSYDKMLAMNGNTATYMQYAYARVVSIFNKGGFDPADVRAGDVNIVLEQPAERALALSLLQFSEALQASVAEYRPNYLTTYLFELANRYSSFFEQCPVLKAETPELRDSRLALCDLTARTIRQGLELLGIRVVEKM
jgi:arginyl-tRNA synthetase